MIAVTDLTRERIDSDDIDVLNEHLRQLVGLPFLSLRTSYPDELKVHLGAPVPYRHPALKDRVRGEYVLGARASEWILITGKDRAVHRGCGADENPPGAITPAELEARTTILPGSRAIAATAYRMPLTWSRSGLCLELRFADGSRLEVRPIPDFDPHDDCPPADWEVLAPGDHCLRAGPGIRWKWVAEPSTDH